MFNRIYKIYIQAEAPYRATRDNIGLFFVRAQNGSMVPLTALGTTSYTTGPGTIKKFNMFSTLPSVQWLPPAIVPVKRWLPCNGLPANIYPIT